MSKPFPLISCVCVTNHKPQMLLRVINCFQAQSYTNKQLVILYEDTDLKTKNFIASNIFTSNIKIVSTSGYPKKTLGELRNIAIESSDGEFVCQWDDDDWYHTDRLRYQHNIITTHGVNASILTRWTVFDNINKRAFISNRRRWEGSVLCRKDIFKLKRYENKSKGEDTDIIDYLHENNHLAYIDDNPLLYIYIFHGNNTWDSNHFSAIFDVSEDFTIASILIENILQQVDNQVNSSLLLNKLTLTPI